MWGPHPCQRVLALTSDMVPPSEWPSRDPTTCSSFICFIYLIEMLFYLPVQKVQQFKSAKKIQKNTSPCKTRIAADPAKCSLKWTKTEWDMLNFCPEEKANIPAHCADWWDWWGLPFWEHPASLLAPGLARPFRSWQWATQMSRALAPLYTNYFDISLGFETTLGSFGEGFVTLTRGGGAQIPLSCAKQVSNALDI